MIERENGNKFQNIEDYAGLSKTQPWMAAVMAIFMLSLAGIPPFAGFFGKYYLFIAAVKGGYTWLTITAVIATIISIYFYIGMIIQMYFKDSKSDALVVNKGLPNLSIIIAVAAIVIFGVFPSLIIDIAKVLFN
jgi:NADH-quinone oxidoreductase subunit N